MSNAKTLAPGGSNSAVGPVLMRKKTPLSVQAMDMAVPQSELFKDSIFSSMEERLRNVSFRIDESAMSPEFNAKVRGIAAQLKRATGIRR